MLFYNKHINKQLKTLMQACFFVAHSKSWYNDNSCYSFELDTVSAKTECTFIHIPKDTQKDSFELETVSAKTECTYIHIPKDTQKDLYM